SVEQQFPALRSQPEHRRQQLRRGEGRCRAQRGSPLEAIPVAGHDHGREAFAVHCSRRREMKKLLSVFALVLVIAPLGAQSTKKAITHDVYDGWRSIQGTKLSRDGAWVAYALNPQEGDGELVVRNLKTSAEIRAPRGRNAVITPDNRFVVFELT